MKKILFVVDEKKMGGVSKVLEDIFGFIKLSDKQITLLVLHDNGEMFSSLPNEINIIYGTPFFDNIDLTLGQAFRTKKVFIILKKLLLIFYLKTGLIKWKIINERKKILNTKYDIEIAFKDGFCAIFTAFGNSRKKIHWLHVDYSKNNVNKNYPHLFKNIYNFYDKIIAVSQPVADSFNQIYHYKNKVDVINNYVNYKKIEKLGNSNADVNYIPNKINVICVGRLHCIKGYDRFLSVIKKLSDENLLDDVIFRIIGDGPERDNLFALNEKLGLHDKVIFLGQQENPYKYIKKSDLFILPSHNESFGLVIVESLILGVPVLSTQIAYADELIVNGKNGIIVNNSFEGLYEGIKNMLVNRDLIKEYKQNLKNYHYNNNLIIDKINRLLGGE